MTALEALLAYQPPKRTEAYLNRCCRTSCERDGGPSGFCSEHADELRDTQ